MKKIIFAISSLRCIPHVIFFLISKNKDIIIQDRDRWLKILNINYTGNAGLIFLLTFYVEYRNLFYYRIGGLSRLLNIICGKEQTLYIITKNIGAGLFIQHGFATIISARSIGKNCWINQQVTIGFSNKTDQPTIMDNVTINAGAKVIGSVTIGENSIIGANAVVVKNIPKNCVAVGVPSYIIKQDGIKVNNKIEI